MNIVLLLCRFFFTFQCPVLLRNISLFVSRRHEQLPWRVQKHKFSSVYITVIWNLTWEDLCRPTPNCGGGGGGDVLPPSWWQKHFNPKWCWSSSLEAAFRFWSRVVKNVGNGKKKNWIWEVIGPVSEQWQLVATSSSETSVLTYNYELCQRVWNLHHSRLWNLKSCKFTRLWITKQRIATYSSQFFIV